MIFVFIQRRHLMVWRVFAPKYLLEVAFSIATQIILLIHGTLLKKNHS